MLTWQIPHSKRLAIVFEPKIQHMLRSNRIHVAILNLVDRIAWAGNGISLSQGCSAASERSLECRVFKDLWYVFKTSLLQSSTVINVPTNDSRELAFLVNFMAHFSARCHASHAPVVPICIGHSGIREGGVVQVRPHSL